MSKTILTIGSATFDIFARAHQSELLTIDNQEFLAFPHGGKVPIDSVREYCGGGATNTAVGFSRLGFLATAAVAIGQDAWGEQVLQNLKTEKVSIDAVQKTGEETGFSMILNSKTGDRTVLAYAGANHSFQFLEPKTPPNALFLGHLAGAAANEMPKIEEWLKKNRQIAVAWNPGYEQLSEGLEKNKNLLLRVQIVFINREEAALLLQKPPQTNVNELLDVLIKVGVSCVVITDGRNGATAATATQRHFCAIDKTAPRVDTLGAGDAFGTGFFWAMLQKKELNEALLCATISATSVVSHFGAQTGLLRSLEIEEKLHIFSPKHP